jgi:hypothetical protein
MRIYKQAGPYHGRKPEMTRAKLGGAILRQSSKQPDGKTPKAAKGGIGDVGDSYLRGQAGGEAHPYFDRQRTSRR